ncbi:MAG: cytochrome c subunit of cbb3 type cytochrome oxidase, partial [Phycisphaerales bacterium]|nr:cytochrome c subunit of cbb3 type cytochrome oxidase [Phycisphaerales bacterium]
DGNGAPGKAASMRGSPLLLGHEGRPIRIVLHGLRGRVVIKGEAADMEMPTLAALNDEQIADALTYVRREWDHRADPVSKDAVAKVREETKDRGQPWSRDEVIGLKFAGEKNPPKAEGKPGQKAEAK